MEAFGTPLEHVTGMERTADGLDVQMTHASAD